MHTKLEKENRSSDTFMLYNGIYLYNFYFRVLCMLRGRRQWLRLVIVVVGYMWW
jgi:hypothetical protein